MKIELEASKSVHENAAKYFELAKKLRKKIEGAKKALEEIERKLETAGKSKQREVEKRERREWYEQFHWAYTSSGLLMIGGKDAQQNELIVQRYFQNSDLFFHADIHGGSIVILKEGISASVLDKLEAAQFTASYSRAWREGYSALSVYCVKKEQVSKHAKEGRLPVGGFAIFGEREWYKHVRLELKVGIKGGKFWTLPGISKIQLEKKVYLTPGGKFKKQEVVKKLAQLFKVPEEEILGRLPAGKFNIRWK